MKQMIRREWKAKPNIQFKTQKQSHIIDLNTNRSIWLEIYMYIYYSIVYIYYFLHRKTYLLLNVYVAILSQSMTKTEKIRHLLLRSNWETKLYTSALLNPAPFWHACLKGDYESLSHRLMMSIDICLRC